MAKPKQNQIRKSVYISKELEESLENEAKEKGTNFSNLVRMILVEREKTKNSWLHSVQDIQSTISQGLS